jgi:hypothetical protein
MRVPGGQEAGEPDSHHTIDRQRNEGAEGRSRVCVSDVLFMYRSQPGGFTTDLFYGYWKVFIVQVMEGFYVPEVMMDLLPVFPVFGLAEEPADPKYDLGKVRGREHLRPRGAMVKNFLHRSCKLSVTHKPGASCDAQQSVYDLIADSIIIHTGTRRLAYSLQYRSMEVVGGTNKVPHLPWFLHLRRLCCVRQLCCYCCRLAPLGYGHQYCVAHDQPDSKVDRVCSGIHHHHLCLGKCELPWFRRE